MGFQQKTTVSISSILLYLWSFPWTPGIEHEHLRLAANVLGKRPALVELQGQSDKTKLRFLMPEPIGSIGWFFTGEDFHFDLPQIIICYGRIGIVMLISHKIHICLPTVA